MSPPPHPISPSKVQRNFTLSKGGLTSHACRQRPVGWLHFSQWAGTINIANWVETRHQNTWAHFFSQSTRSWICDSQTVQHLIFFWGDLGREQYQSLYGVNSDGISLYWNQSACIRVDGECSKYIDIEIRGVRQGCVMSKDLFNYYSELILRELEKERGLRIWLFYFILR